MTTPQQPQIPANPHGVQPLGCKKSSLKAALRTWVKPTLRWVLSAMLVTTGTAHLIHPGNLVRIMPRLIPFPYFFVIFTGYCELAAAVGLQAGLVRGGEKIRRLAAWCLVVFLILVFPANIYMALHPEITEKFIGGASLWGLSAATCGWLRLPLQLPLIAWAWWYTRPTTT